MTAPTVLVQCRHTDGQPRMTNAQAVASAKQLSADHRGTRIVPVRCVCGDWAVTRASRVVRATRERRRRRRAR